MKRFLPFLSLCAFMIFGAILLFRMGNPLPAVGWEIVAGKGKLHWNPRTKEITLHQHSDNLVIDQGPDAVGDFANFTVVRDKPGASTLLRVMTGKPTILQGKLKSYAPLHIINPNGMIVGPNMATEPKVRVIKAHGNVYALAINREGTIYAARSGGSIEIANPKAEKSTPVIEDETN